MTTTERSVWDAERVAFVRARYEGYSKAAAALPDFKIPKNWRVEHCPNHGHPDYAGKHYHVERRHGLFGWAGYDYCENMEQARGCVIMTLLNEWSR